MSRTVSILWLALGMASCGCVSVTTKITGSSRAGAEQLLLTGTSDRAVGSIDFRPLSGHRVYLETSQVSAADSGWVIFSLRREMARQGLLLVSDKKEAQTLIEAALVLTGQMRSIADSPFPARSRWDYCRFRPAGRLPTA